MLLDTAAGEVIAPPLLYNDPCPEALPALKRFAPEGHTVLAATSTLAKLATWHSQGAWKAAKSPALLHQARAERVVRRLLLLCPTRTTIPLSCESSGLAPAL